MLRVGGILMVWLLVSVLFIDSGIISVYYYVVVYYLSCLELAILMYDYYVLTL